MITPAGPRRAEHNAAPLNTFAKEDCVNVRPPPISGTSDRRSLNADLMGIKHRDHGPSSSLANSMTSHHGHSHWIPHAKRPLNCSWLTLKSHRSQKDTICHHCSFLSTHIMFVAHMFIYWMKTQTIPYCCRILMLICQNWSDYMEQLHMTKNLELIHGIIKCWLILKGHPQSIN